MQHILYIENARHLSIEQGGLVVYDNADEKERIHPQDILAIVLENPYCQVSLPALLLAIDHAIPVLICNTRHQPQIYCIDYYRHSELREKIIQQIGWTEDRKCQAWKQIIHTKIQHQIDLLQLKHPSKKWSTIEQYQQTLQQSDISTAQINTAESIAARLYFSALFGSDFKRFAEDHLNHALNYGYAIVRALIMVAITVKGLHPALGIWHHSVKNRFNLADDLIETLRPLVDYQVSKMTAEKTLDQTHKITLLTTLHTTVYWEDRPCSLRQAINLYLDEFIRFMNKKSDKLRTISLKFDIDESM